MNPELTGGAHRQYYSGLGKGETPTPLHYRKFPVPINDGGVRLVIFKLADQPELASLAEQATHDVFKALPAGGSLRSHFSWTS